MKSSKKTFTKKISKVLLSLLTLSLAFPNGITTSAATVDQTTVNFTVTGEQKAGNIVDVAVNVNNATDLYGASVDFAFDKTLVEVQSVTPGSVFPANVNVPVKKTGIVPGISETAITLTGSQKATSTTGTVAIMKVKLLKDGKVTLKANSSDAALSETGINVRLKLANSTAANIAYTATDKDIIIGPIPAENVKIATFAADKASGQAINSTITFTATATPATGTTYEFAVQEGTTWATKQAYSPKNTFAWVPTVAGNYVVKVTAKGTNGSTDSKEMVYVINGVDGPSKLTSFTTDKASSQLVGTIINLKADATPATTSEYQFIIFNGKDWVTVQNYSPQNTFAWKPTLSGNYTLRVRTRNAALPGSASDFRDINFTVTDSNGQLPSKLTSFTTSKVSGQPANTTITLTGNATPSGTSEYQFMVGDATGANWVTLQSYSSKNTFDWKPTAAGNYTLRVRARNAALPGSASDFNDIKFTITDGSVQLPSKLTSFTTSKVSGQPTNTTITLTANATPATTSEYIFMVGDASGKWVTVQEYSIKNTVDWKPTTAGTYTLRVRARNAALPGSASDFRDTTFKVN